MIGRVLTASSNTTTILRQRPVTLRQGERERTEQRWFAYTPAVWKGRAVVVESDAGMLGDCLEGHELVLLDHYGVPTGWVYCRVCCGIAQEQDGSDVEDDGP